MSALFRSAKQTESSKPSALQVLSCHAGEVLGKLMESRWRLFVSCALALTVFEIARVLVRLD
ncbi:MAG: hypothetical protein DME53_02315 [Verrucomicrobia bacterium]|nr:MAG: hypothetical protein DME53_02315 [Verrucomicrobiota bacterium]